MTLPDLSRTRILIFGDVMLDEYVVGDAARISPEAPIPIFRYGSKYAVPGGAANVAAGVAALGASATLCGLVGADGAAGELREAIGRRAPQVRFSPVVDPNRATTVKTRYLASGHQMLRVDHESAAALSPDVEQALVSAVSALVEDADAIIVSDYAKGAVGEAGFRALVEAARCRRKPLFVDPKRRDLAFYRGADYLTPNRRELQEATGLGVEGDAAIEAACTVIRSTIGADTLVTRSEEGLSLARAGLPVLHIRASARDVFDVSGAGDTVIATFASTIAAGLMPDEAARLANLAAGIAVSKRGTAIVSAAELRRASRSSVTGHTETHNRAMSLEEAIEQSRGWRHEGLRVGFTNGCFDILHAGHVRLLDQVSRACDRLIVGLNSDASVRALKGPTRPINGEDARAGVLLGLRSVDAVVVFDEATPARLIQALSPDLLAKGGDYRRDEIVGADWVESSGGVVMIVDMLAGYSTSATVASMRGVLPLQAAE